LKGILFNHLEILANQLLSSTAWVELCNELPLTTKELFIANRTYPDSDLIVLVEGLTQRAKLPLEDTWRRFGKLSIVAFMEKYPSAIGAYKTPMELFKKINYMHFTEVRNLFNATELPYFLEERADEHTILLRYISKRQMCHYLEGAIDGVGMHFRTPIGHSQITCVHRGGKHCDFEITLP
jgi:hypothetical protein